MSSNHSSQEFHEDVSEYFPEYGSLKNSFPVFKKKKAVLGKILGTASATAVLALAVFPYVVCHPISIGENTAVFSTKVMNSQPDTVVSYYVSEYPGMSDEQLLQQIASDPNRQATYPEDGMLEVKGLDPRTPYKLVFYTQDLSQPDAEPEILSKYSFSSGNLPVPEWIQTLQELLKPEKHPEAPEPIPTAEPETQPEETRSTEPPTQPPTEPPTEAPTEAPVVPPMTAPITPPTDAPATEPPPVPPAPEPPPVPPTPEPPPALPEVTTGTPAANFSERSDGQHVFSVDFPFNVKNATASRGEFVITHIHSDGSTTADAPISAAVTQTGTGATLSMNNAAVPMGEGIRIEPALYYQDGAGKEAKLTGTAYEAAPGGVDSTANVNFRFTNEAGMLSYSVDLSNIKQPVSGQPAGSALVIESFEFIFLDNKGNPAGTPQILPLGEAVSGTAYSKTGTMSLPYDPYSDCQKVQVNVHAAWKIGGQNAVVSSTGLRAGTAAGVTVQSASLESAVIVPGTSNTKMMFKMPFLAQNVVPQNIHIEATVGSNVFTSDGLTEDIHTPGYCFHTITCEAPPGENVSVVATLTYDDNGTVKTSEPSYMDITTGSMTNANGTFRLIHSGSDIKYEMSLYDVVNPAVSGMETSMYVSFSFLFTPTGGGTPLRVTTVPAAEYFTAGYPSGFDTLRGTLVASEYNSLPSGDYYVTAELKGTWYVAGNPAQLDPTVNHPDSIKSLNIVTKS